MSRTITLSTKVFAAIWANRRDGEETEDAILRRLLDCGDRAQANGFQDERKDKDDVYDYDERKGGVYDARNDVHFPEGFEVFRSYKHREYKAVAQSGFWVREDTGKRFRTLNRLNESIASGKENVWNGSWKYRTSDGLSRSIDTLRGAAMPEDPRVTRKPYMARQAVIKAVQVDAKQRNRQAPSEGKAPLGGDWVTGSRDYYDQSRMAQAVANMIPVIYETLGRKLPSKAELATKIARWSDSQEACKQAMRNKRFATEYARLTAESRSGRDSGAACVQVGHKPGGLPRSNGDQ